MNIAEFAIKKKTITLVVTVVMIVVGISAFNSMPRLEDPEFTIKDALVITAYPGATAAEVEEEVTEVIEKAAQQLGQLKRVESRSVRGVSTVTVSIKDKYKKDILPQVWDELRRKVNDAQSQLPPGVQPSVVVDDYGDVFGIYYGITGDGYSYADLEEVAKLLQRELLLVPDVKRIDFFGIQPEVVYIELLREKFVQFGITKETIYGALADKNLVANAGRLKTGGEYIPIQPTGGFESVEDFADVLISAPGDGNLVFLGDIATIHRGYAEPASDYLRIDGENAVGLAISTAAGGNVVTMGEALTLRLAELKESGEIPFGVELDAISMQSEAVTIAIQGFVISLLQAIAIVVVVLVLFMGLRSGLLIGFILFMTICASFVVMRAQGIVLERISLGALIIALGMLVDNAIVVTDGMQVKIQAGVDRLKAAKDIVGQSMTPLLGATVIAVLAFASIGTSDDNTGEYCSSLYQVILISLMMSWVTAVTVTPLLCYMFIKPATKTEGNTDPYSGALFQGYRRLLTVCLKRRVATCALMVAMLALSLFGFTRIEQSFFPSSTRPQFMVDIWLQEGTHIDETVEEVSKVEGFLMGLDGVTGVSTFVGKGGNRFLLTYTPEKQYPSFAQMLVDVEDYKTIDALMDSVREGLDSLVPQARVFPQKFVLGPAKPGKIQARFSGPDPQTLRELAQQAIDLYHADGDLTNIHIDWRTKVKVMEPVLSEAPARANGVTRSDLARTMQEAFEGTRVGVYREGDTLLPIIARAPLDERDDVGKARDLFIWSPAAGQMIPIMQVVSGFQTVFEDPIVNRRNRQRTIIAKADPAVGNASVMFKRVRPGIEAIELPPGYAMEWGGEYEDSANAQAGLAATIPMFIGIMILVTVFLFNSIRQPLIIWLCVPLAIVGVTAGLLVTGQPFGFMPLLGLLSLIGMLIKNAIVLIDQINFESGEGKDTYTAIMDSGVSRLRPVMMAASTTVLGMIPLVADAFFVSMAITIMFGLAFASVLTLILVPVLYAMFYKAVG